MRSLLTPVAVAAVLVSGCASGPSDGEKRACAAAERLVEAEDRDEMRDEIGRMISEAKSAGNDALEKAARDFEKGVDDFDPPATEAAIGRFYDACEDAGVELKPFE